MISKFITRDLQSNCEMLKDMLNLIWCFNASTNEYKKYQKNINSKINECLSIETLIEKIHLIELIAKMTLQKDIKESELNNWIEINLTNNMLNSNSNHNERNVFQN